MDWVVLLFFVAITLWVAGVVLVVVGGIWGSVDAASWSREAWDAAGRRRWVWVAQVVLIPTSVGMLLALGWYLWRVRPRVRAAEVELSIGAQQQWTASAGSSAGVTDEVTLRVPLGVTAGLRVVPLPVGWLIGVSMAGGLHEVIIMMPSMLGCLGAAFVVAGLGWLLDRTKLSSAGLRRWRRTVPWREIASINPYRTFGMYQLRVYDVTGRKLRLRAPLSGFGLGRAEFDRQSVLIRDTWLANRGDRPVPAG